MKLDTTLVGTLADAGRVAKRAEDMGFAGIFSVEAQATPFLPLAVAADATERIDLATGIAVAFARSPMVLAMTAWDLQKASRGRFVLGLGTQIRKHIERRYSAAFDHPGPRMRDMIRCIRHIWGAFDGEHKLDYHGEFYTSDYVQPFFNPGPSPFGKPRIFVAAVGPWMCRMAGEVCDGILIHPFHTVRYIEEVVRPNVRAGLAAAGRSEDDFEYATTSFVITGDAAQQANLESLARAQLAFYGSTPNYKAVFDLHGWGDFQPRLQQLVREGKLAEGTKLFTDEILGEFCVRASFEELGAAIRKKYDGVVDRLGFYLPVVGSGQEEEWAGVVRDVAN